MESYVTFFKIRFRSVDQTMRIIFAVFTFFGACIYGSYGLLSESISRNVLSTNIPASPKGFIASSQQSLDFHRLQSVAEPQHIDTSNMTFPDFYIIGAQTECVESLRQALDNMTIGCSNGGEGDFWSHSEVVGQNLAEHLPTYLAKWSYCDPGALKFDKTPEYSFHPFVPMLISEYAPLDKQKIVFVLRDPIYRAFTGFMQERNGYGPGDSSLDAFHQMVTFEIAIVQHCKGMKIDSADYPRCCTEAVRSVDPSFEKWQDWQGCGDSRWWFQNHVRRGMYHDQLAQWYRYVHRDEVLIFIAEEMFHNPGSAAFEINTWIRTKKQLPQENMEQKLLLNSDYQEWRQHVDQREYKTRARHLMRNDTYELLANFYRSLHKDLELLLGRNITRWSYMRHKDAKDIRSQGIDVVPHVSEVPQAGKKIIMLGQSVSGGESISEHFSANNLTGDFYYFRGEANIKLIQDWIQEDIDANDCSLPGLDKFTGNFLGDWKPEYLDFVNSGFAANRREGLSKLVRCMHKRYDNAVFVWNVRQPCNWVSSDAVFGVCKLTGHCCRAFQNTSLATWLNDQCAIFDLYRDDVDFRQNTVPLPLADFNNSDLIVEHFSRVGIDITGSIPHIGHHGSCNQYPKMHEDFPVLRFLKKACADRELLRVRQSEGYTHVGDIACPHRCELPGIIDVSVASNLVSGPGRRLFLESSLDSCPWRAFGDDRFSSRTLPSRAFHFDHSAGMVRFKDWQLNISEVSLFPQTSRYVSYGFTASSDLALHLYHGVQQQKYANVVDFQEKLPDFLIIGTHKSGTDSLKRVFESLKIGCSGGGEGHFWEYHDPSEPGFAGNFTRYLSKWKDCEPHALRFDETPVYSFIPKVPRVIGQVVPAFKQKIVFVLRDPIARALLGFKQERLWRRQQNGTTIDDSPDAFHHMVLLEITVANKCRGMEIDSKHHPHCCTEAVRGIDPQADQWEGCGKKRLWFQNHVRRGLYYDQLTQWFRYIHRDNILIFTSEEVSDHISDVRNNAFTSTQNHCT